MRGAFQRGGLAAAAALLALALIEGGLRAGGVRVEVHPPTQYLGLGESLVVSRHPLYPDAPGTAIDELFYRYRPGAVWATRYPSNPRGTFDERNMVVYRMNNAGFRDGDFTPEKPEGGFRIALVGDSVTLGEGVGPDDIFAAVLERRLREGPCPQCEVLNFGVNGYGIHDELVLLATEVAGYRPDLVILVYFPNDISHQGGNRLAAEVTALRGRWEAFLRTPSVAVNLVAQRLLRASVARRTEAFFRDMYGPGRHWEELRGLLGQFRQRVADSGGRLLVALFPDLSAVAGGTYALAWIGDQVGAELRAAGVPVVDLAPALLREGGAELTVHPADAHPNEAGHRIVARELLDALGRSDLLPPPASPASW